MIIKKFENGNINLKLTNEKTFNDILLSGDLFENDLALFRGGYDDSMLIYDNYNCVLYKTNEHADIVVKKLLSKKSIKFIQITDQSYAQDILNHEDASMYTIYDQN